MQAALADLSAGLEILLTFETIAWVIVGSILGIILGALPGLTATMGLALMLPVSFYLPTATGMALLLFGLYRCGIRRINSCHSAWYSGQPQCARHSRRWL